MNNYFEQNNSAIPFASYLAELNNEFDENSEDLLNFSSGMDINPEGFFGINDSFNFIFNNQNIFISKAETNENTNLRSNKFNITTRNLSGRKRNKNSNRKIHDKNFNDNILRKINVNFLNFIISFLNQVLSKYYKNEKFYKINANYKKKINKKNFNLIKNETIAQILVQENSLKFTNREHNRELLKKIKDDNIEIMNRILSKSYINIFKELYYCNKKKITYEGLELNLKKTFADFLAKLRKKENSLYIQNIEKVVQKYYFPKLFEIQI